MPRPTSRKKEPASEVLVELRTKLRLTQAQLAAKLGVAVQTVGRWESYNPPRGATLQRLVQFAEEQHCYAWAGEFRTLIQAERGAQMESDEESRFTLAVLEILRKPEWAHLRPLLKRDLEPVLEALQAIPIKKGKS